MKLTVSCKICGRVVVTVQKDDDFSYIDMEMYKNSSTCEVDGPFQTYDDMGNPLFMDFSNIVVSKTLS